MTEDTRPDYASLVPRYQFADTLDVQEAQLAENPLMRRFAASRRNLASDPYRPIYHFVSPESTMNDPNGLCYWQDRWHLFYQGYPIEDRRQHWGHAVSEDLVHWRDLPYAIYPNPEEKCYSGATLVEDDRVIAIYHGTRAGNMVAVSSDPLLLNWEKVTGQAVIPLAKPDGSRPPYRVFDPCIWHKAGTYFSLSGGTLPHVPSGRRTRADFLLRSLDLKTWEYLHPFVEADRFTMVGDDGACPYFWPIGDRHILLFFSHVSGGQALVGDYDTVRDKFVVTSHHLFNFGPSGPAGVHAPSATPDDEGGVFVIFNMNSAKPTGEWNQLMTLPRRLTLPGTSGTDRDVLRVEPVGAVDTLRHAHQHIDRTVLPANEELVLEGIRGNAMELAVEINSDEAPMVELNVLRSPNKEEFTRIAFYRHRGYRNWQRYAGSDGQKRKKARDSLISIDSSYASGLPDFSSRAPETAPVYLEPEEPLRLRVFVDRSVVEVFANGKQCVALRVYPGREDSLGVSLRSQGRDATLCYLDAWQMHSIYE